MEIPVLEYLDTVLTIVPTSAGAEIIPLEADPDICYQMVVGGSMQVVRSKFPSVSVRYAETLVKLWAKQKAKVMDIKCQVAI